MQHLQSNLHEFTGYGKYIYSQNNGLILQKRLYRHLALLTTGLHHLKVVLTRHNTLRSFLHWLVPPTA
jgi:hypothetical protein